MCVNLLSVSSEDKENILQFIKHLRTLYLHASRLIDMPLVKRTYINVFISMLIIRELNSTMFSANYHFMCQYG